MPSLPLDGGSAPDPPRLGGPTLRGAFRPKKRPRRPLRERIPWLPYVLPLLLFLALTALEGQLAGAYPLVYAAKAALVTLVLWRVRPFVPELRWQKTGMGTAILLGIALCPLWVLLDHITPHAAFLGTRAGFNPFAALPNAGARAVFLLVRFWGLIVVAPAAEELFLRAFLLRWLTAPERWRSLAPGTFTSGALAGTVLLMAFSHPEWLSAALFALAMGWLLRRTGNVSACILAHGVTNALLGLYVVAFHDWKYW